jgi:hypothetical protein
MAVSGEVLNVQSSPSGPADPVAPRPTATSVEPSQLPAQTAAPELKQAVPLREDPESTEVAHKAFEMPVAHRVEWPQQKPFEPTVDAAVAPSTEAAASQWETSAVAPAGTDVEGKGAPEAVRLEPDRSRETAGDGDATSGDTAMECDAELFDVATPCEGHEVEAAA